MQLCSLTDNCFDFDVQILSQVKQENFSCAGAVSSQAVKPVADKQVRGNFAIISGNYFPIG